MKRNIKQRNLMLLSAVLALVLLALSFAACGHSDFDMPYNGEVKFHEISINVPRSYIRDSSQSTGELWVFEKGWYSQMLILSRTTVNGSAAVAIENYAAALGEQGVSSERVIFLGMEALSSEKKTDGETWREMLFYRNGYFYAIGLRGGTAEDFKILLESVSVESAQGTQTKETLSA